MEAAGGDVGLDHRTAEGYVRLLEAVFLVYRLPAWGKTLGSLSAAKPKLHILDSGVAARQMRLSAAKLARRDPTVRSELGHLLETFVVEELLKQASWYDGLDLSREFRGGPAGDRTQDQGIMSPIRLCPYESGRRIYAGHRQCVRHLQSPNDTFSHRVSGLNSGMAIDLIHGGL